MTAAPPKTSPRATASRVPLIVAISTQIQASFDDEIDRVADPESAEFRL